VRLAILSPDLLGTYGDWGNAVVLAKRLAWRGIGVETIAVTDGATPPRDADLYVLGGGEDGPQTLAVQELGGWDVLRAAVSRGAVVFGVCAGLQLLGEVFPGPDGAPHHGLGLVDLRTERGTVRAIGEVVAEPDPHLGIGPLTGFENHLGVTTVGPSAAPLATVVSGRGNGAGGVEGVRQQRILGTYLHGPVLARNPALADLLLGWVVGPLPPLEVPAVDELRTERLAAGVAAGAGPGGARRRAARWARRLGGRVRRACPPAASRRAAARRSLPGAARCPARLAARRGGRAGVPTIRAMLELDGGTAVVTGAASGIGLALTRRLLGDGMRVAMADVEVGALDAAARELGADAGRVLAVPTDVSDAGAVEALAARVTGEWGAVRLVCANAGVTASAALWDSTLDDWEWLWRVNVLGVVHTVRAFLPAMVAAGAPAHVCITGSLAGYLNQPGFGAYNASKHAVTAIAETLAADLDAAGHPIGVTIVAPWFVQTRLAEAARNRPAALGDLAPVTDHMRRIWSTLAPTRHLAQTPEQVADLAVDAVVAGRFSVFPFGPSVAAVRDRFEAVLDGRALGLYLPDPAAPTDRTGPSGSSRAR
jgi:CobQ-like glutamine amidotransferase family enzyme/NAD(P)-dependent dehydrogenase (short-subunit alcohol dehydrogenase family)